MGLRIVEYKGLTGFKELEASWRRLYASMPERTGNHSFELHLARAECADLPDDLRCFVLTDGGEVRVICPLEVLIKRKGAFSVAVYRAFYESGDVIAPEDEYREAFLPLLFEYFKHTGCRYPFAIIGPVATSSRLWDGLSQLKPSAYVCERENPEFHSATLDCRGPYSETIKARLSPRFRRNLRWAGNKLANFPGVSFTSIREEPELSAAFEEFLDLEASGWKGSAGTALRQRGDCYAELYRRPLTVRGPNEYGEINLLHAEGRCIAAQIATCVNGEYKIYKIAYDERYAKASPGQLLMERTLQRCCEDPAIESLNLISNMPWLESWRPTLLRRGRMYLSLSHWSSPFFLFLLRRWLALRPQ